MWIRRSARHVMFAEHMDRPSAAHRHFPIQLSLGISAPLSLQVEGNASEVVAGFVIASQVEHGQYGANLNFFVDPLIPLGRRLRGLLAGRTHCALDAAHVARFWGDVPSARWLDGPCGDPDDALDTLLDALGAKPAPELDIRIARVVERLRADVSAGGARSALAELAALAGLSTSRLTHLFTEQVGLPIKQYLVWLRMEAVLARFASSDQLGTLAHDFGFPDQAAFTRAYRAAWGRTPTSFRSRVQHEADAVAAVIKRA